MFEHKETTITSEKIYGKRQGIPKFVGTTKQTKEGQ
jgi:hypothetical protein